MMHLLLMFTESDGYSSHVVVYRSGYWRRLL